MPRRLAFLALALPGILAAADLAVPAELRPFFAPPPEHAGRLGAYRSPLLRDDGSLAASAADWPARRREILDHWHRVMGPWPERVARPRVELSEQQDRDGVTQHRVELEVADRKSVV